VEEDEEQDEEYEDELCEDTGADIQRVIR